MESMLLSLCVLRIKYLSNCIFSLSSLKESTYSLVALRASSFVKEKWCITTKALSF